MKIFASLALSLTSYYHCANSNRFMQEFTISEQGIKQINKQLLRYIIPFLFILIIGFIVVNVLTMPSKKESVNTLPYALPVFVGIVCFGFYRGAQRRKQLLRSYKVSITPNAIMRQQYNTPDIALYHSEINEIAKTRRGAFFIKGKDSSAIICVPSQIERRDELEATLHAIFPITEKGNLPLLQKAKALLAVLMAALMICVYVSTNKILVAVSGVLVTGLLIWSFFEVQRNRNIDKRTRRSTWWVVLVLLSIIANVIMKLSASKGS